MNFSQLQGERYKRLPMAAQIISDCKVMHRLQGYRGDWSLLASKQQAMRESLPVWTRLYFLLNLWSFSGLVSVLNSWFFEFLFLGFLVPSVQPCGSSSSLDLIQRLPPYRSAVSRFLNSLLSTFLLPAFTIVLIAFTFVSLPISSQCINSPIFLADHLLMLSMFSVLISDFLYLMQYLDYKQQIKCLLLIKLSVLSPLPELIHTHAEYV